MQVYLDADGDGFGIGSDAIAVADCGDGAEPPAGYARAGGDCDDADPDAHLVVALDADGDGRGLASEARCGSLDDEGYVVAALAEDCDDADPDRWELLYVDADGDDFGVPTSTRCGGEDGEEGFAVARWGEDCDDADPERHPYAVENFGDSVDSDCDGADGAECFATWTASGDVAPAAGTSACAEAIDLAVLRLSDCDALCSVQTYVQLVNLGGIAFQGAVTLRVYEMARGLSEVDPPVELEHLRQTVELALDPGEATLPILVGYVNSGGGGAGFLIRVDPGFGDCAPENDEAAFLGTHVDCF